MVITPGRFIYFYRNIFNYIIVIKSHGDTMTFFIVKGGKIMKSGDLKVG